MDVAYLILAGLLALFYAYGGGLKLVRSRDRLRPMMAWVDRMPMAAVRALGVVELAGAAGLVLPPVTGLAAWLAAVAAAGLVVLQLGALRVHLTSEDRQVGLNLVLLVTAAATTWLATTWW